ncbi:MAG: repair protein RecN [Actinomycetota bacterium]
MIEEIKIRDLGVIREATLAFGPGLNVLTGETGAGKTMVLTALGLLLGERSDSTAIRQGQDQAFVEGRWFLSQPDEVGELVSQAGGDIDGGDLLVNRSVTRDGRARASVGGASVPVGMLAGLGERLVVVHGQADQIRLKSATAQREALDRFAGLGVLLSDYRICWNAWREAQSRLSELKALSANRVIEAEGLRSAIEELDRLQPIAGEDLELAETAERLTHSEELRLAATSAHELLSSEGFEDSTDAIGLVGKARRILEQASTHDPELGRQAEVLKELGFQLGESAAALSGYLANAEAGGAAELERVQQRRAELSAAIRKYGPTLSDVVSFHESAGRRLLDLDSSDEQIETLEAQVSALESELRAKAGLLTEARKVASEKLAASVTTELAGLAMAGSSLVVDVKPAGELGAHGADLISIQLSAYPGAEPRALGKGASGGELSRIMLAIEVVLASSHEAPTFIFDEVDAGVGGAAAIEVGRRLANLAKFAQVIVVTHLGQVAAFASKHLRVLKTVDDSYTASDVVTLEGEARIEEIARMLSGMGESDTAKASARELVDRAAALINY